MGRKSTKVFSMSKNVWGDWSPKFFPVSWVFLIGGIQVSNNPTSPKSEIAPTNFKSYDELKTRLDTVLAGTVSVGNVTNVMEDEPVETTVTVDTKESPAPTVDVSDDEEDGLAWQRLAIETNPNYGGSWNEIGEALLQRGQAEMAIKWFRGAINSVNYCERGAAWANLARAHLEMGRTTSALFAAQEAAALMPDEDELDELLEQLTDGLA